MPFRWPSPSLHIGVVCEGALQNNAAPFWSTERGIWWLAFLYEPFLTEVFVTFTFLFSFFASLESTFCPYSGPRKRRLFCSSSQLWHSKQRCRRTVFCCTDSLSQGLCRKLNQHQKKLHRRDGYGTSPFHRQTFTDIVTGTYLFI